MNQVKFFRKNKIDLQNTNVSITVTDSIATSTGSSIVDYIRNRNNRSAWVTTGSADSGNTTLEIDMGDIEDFDNLILIKHNWKSFTIQYWDGFAWQDFSTPISETVNSESVTTFSFTKVSAQKIKIVITGTQTADSDKELYQLIVGDLVGQLQAWPELKNVKHVSNKRKNKMLSGKINIVEPIGRFSCQLNVKYWNIQDDITLMENLYFNRNPMLVWLCGGDESQFAMTVRGYRKEDIFLMRTSDDFRPDWVNGVYSGGLNMRISLDEVTD